jgi:glycosyltransferase involved in cell wall biosynthesis
MKILWIGDAVVASGFGRCTSKILEQVIKSHDAVVLGVNYHGDPHSEPYKVYPAQQPGSHPLGVGRLRFVLEREAPDMIVIQTNPWHVPAYTERIRKWSTAPIVGIIAVEGKNPGGHYLKSLDHAIFWTQFGLDEARKGGYTGTASVIPLGVDLEAFQPGSTSEARRRLQLPKDVEAGFIVLNVNRNQHRKRLDLSIIAFAKWVKDYYIDDAFLYLHAMEGSTIQLDVDGLTQYCGIPKRVVHAEPVDVYQGASHAYLLATIQASDVGLSTSLGEGWGLTTMESMACGKANIATEYSAIPEWAGNTVKLVPVASEGVMPDVYGQLGGTPNVNDIVGALHELYTNRTSRGVLAHRGLQRVSEPQFRWENIGQRYAKTLERVHDRILAERSRRVQEEPEVAPNGSADGSGPSAVSGDGSRSDGVQEALSR